MKPYVEYDATKHGDYRTSRFHGTCKWCGQAFYPGDRVNWNPRVRGTACHAGCYKAYGSPNNSIGTEVAVTGILEPVFVPNPNSKPETKPEPIAVSKPSSDGLPQAIVDAIIPYLENRLQGLVTEEQVTSILDKVIGDRTVKTITTIKIEKETEYGIESRDIGVQHCMFEDLLDMLKSEVYPWIAGPAGSGKTTACEQVAKALDFGFFMTGAIDNEYKLTGFTTANGMVVSTEFRRAVEYAIAHPETGAIFLWDEVDRSFASALLAFNAVLSNGLINFPDMQLRKPDNLYFVACANTWGTGPNADYVGAMKQDAAFVDRFVPLYWDYDENLERAITHNDAWVNRVQEVRARVKAKGIKVMITPRSSVNGAKLLARGVLQSKVEERLLRKSMTLDQWNSVK